MKNKKNIRTLNLYTLVEKCLNDSRYDWRTVKGISKTLHVSAEKIEKVLKKMCEENIVVVGYRQKHDIKIYAFYENYEKRSSFIIKYIDAIKGKIIR